MDGNEEEEEELFNEEEEEELLNEEEEGLLNDKMWLLDVMGWDISGEDENEEE
jgi:hypothetical protein